MLLKVQVIAQVLQAPELILKSALHGSLDKQVEDSRSKRSQQVILQVLEAKEDQEKNILKAALSSYQFNMAEAFLQHVLENLNSLIQDEIGLIMGVDEDMKKLFSAFTTIQAVLEDAEEKQLESKPIQNWLCKLDDLAYEIDDILDECATHVSKLKLRDGKLSRYSLKKILFRHNIGRRMKEVTGKLDTVAVERAKFHLREIPVDKQREVAAARETGSILNESHQVFGRDEDKEKFVDILVNHVKENQQMSVLPIIGVGGLGKTTLAQLVFNDYRVTELFERKLWICVSDNFDLKTLVRAMIESATGSGSASDLIQLDTLERHLWELLNGKRYLLVLDDVWNTDQEKWFVLKNILACGSNGTSIIVTTRLKMVADIMGTVPPHRLTGLSEEHCWLLLRGSAFREEEREKYPNLEVIGKQIVKKCGGVPMAAKALGGLLRFKRIEKEWNYVKESEIWNLPPEETLILPALRLSYHHLPLALRQCFVYFAVFPKDFQIRKKSLIALWVAHGYISTRGILDVEDVGNEICNELVLRSLFQYHPSDDSDLIIMHDLVHDLAQSIMESKVPGVQVERQATSISNRKIRQVNLREKRVAFPACVQHDMDVSSILIKLSRLRVLDASGTSIKEFPSTVGNLKHIRLLNLSESHIRTLPNSLCSLWNLQTLNLNFCLRLVALPKNMRYLNNLRHLCLECTSLRGMPSKIGELTCLKTLSQFMVGHNRGNQLEELRNLNLGGKLEIKHMERVESYSDAEKANLVEKLDLRHLSLEWESNIHASKSREDTDEKVLEALRPPPNLESLSIRGSRGRSFPVWMADSAFIKMIRIDILDCQNCLRLPQLGELPHLIFLRLEKVAVEYIIEGGSPVSIQFPSLERLELCSLPHLKGVLKEQASTQVLLPKLAHLLVGSCSSFILPELSSLQELDVRNCSSIMLSPFAKLVALTSLTVEFGENMQYIAIETMEKLSSLKSLSVYKPQEMSLPEEGLRALKSLTHLWIKGTETFLPPRGWLRHLLSLKCITIEGCSEFVELPGEIEDLHSLETVHFFNVRKMVCLPKALQHLSSLKQLILHTLPHLSSLPDWLHNLTSLQSFYIDYCPKLVSLPAGIRGMPNLHRLVVTECPELERPCERRTGEDWRNSSHIPNLHIGND